MAQTIKNCVRVLVGLVGASVLLAPGAQGQDRSGVRPEVLSLPDGPGSIEGLGESFEPNMASGTSSYEVGITVPPGIVGFQPGLALRYSSGGGNGELGIGWSLGVPSVQRGTDHGLPRYDDTDQLVLRGLGGGAEDLVQLVDGSWRFRIEGAFVRGRQRDDGSWEFRNRSGIRFRFGTSGASTVRDGDRVFGWMLTEQEDTHGHVIRYEWERNAAGQPELARVVYNDFSPEVRNVIEIEREDRPDVVTSYLATFPVTTSRRIARITVTHGGRLVRRYDLGYSMMLGLSRLASVRMVGTDGVTALPTLSLDYIDFAPDSSELVTMEDAPARALGEVAEIDDVDGDALPDLLVADPALDGGRYSWIPNLDGVRWGEGRVMSTSPSVWLSSHDVQLADMNGDGAADVLARVSDASDGMRFYPAGLAAGANDQGFAAAVVIRPAPSFGFEDPDVHLADLDHDRRPDWIRIDPTTGEMFVAFNSGDGSFTAARSVGRLAADEVLTFSRDRLSLADMNGDGLADLVALRSGSLRYWASRGFGDFDDALDVMGAPALAESELVATQIRDLNGDGLADLVHVGVSGVRCWLALATGTLLPAMEIEGTPELRPTTVVRVADMNGNGTADIVWIDPSSATPWRYLDVLPHGTPGLLAQIDNGIGRVTRIEYAGLGAMRSWARERGVAWSHRSPIGQTVVSAVETETGLDPVVRYELLYAGGHYDGEHREFRGFATSVRRDLGDEEQPTLVTETRFDVGDTEEAFKGMPLEVERRTEEGGVFDREMSRYSVLTLEIAADGSAVRHAFRDRLDRFVYELGAEAEIIRTEWSYDDFGNVVREAQYGILDEDGDESISVRSYATSPTEWILDRIASERIENAAGGRLAETRTYYDGASLEGLPLGAVGTRGDVSRTESWIRGDEWQLDVAYERDDHGNVTLSTDARGGRTEVRYDPASQTLVEGERQLVGDDRWIEWSATYDLAFGVVRRVVEPNGHATEVEHDALGRIVAIADPGDTLAHPTRAFEYVFGAPLSYVREETRERPGEATRLVFYRHVDGAGRTRAEMRRADAGRWVLEGLVRYGARGLEECEAQTAYARSADVPHDLEARACVRTTYDAVGRAVREVQVDGSEIQTEYGALTVTVHDANDLDPLSDHFATPTTRRLDGLEQLREVIERADDRDIVTAYEYDALGNLVRVVDAAGSERAYEYDGRSRRVRIEDPNAGVWRMSFDGADALTERLDPEGNRVAMRYDLLGRVVEEEHRLGTDGAPRVAVRFHYDVASDDHPELGNVIGRLAWVEDEAGREYFAYDDRGRQTDRLRLWADGTEHRTWSDYDSAGRLTRRGFPDGTHLEFRYDARGLIDEIPGVVPAMDWTATGELESISFGNGVTDRHHYDARLQLQRVEARAADGYVLRDLEYARDRTARITSLRDRRPDVTTADDLSAMYTFDDRQRLVREATATAVTTWRHDDVGNILATSGEAGTIERRYGEGGAGPDQLTSLGDESLVYDRAGRLLRDRERTYEWDAEGRLARTQRGALVEEYVYAWDDARVVKRDRMGDRETVTLYPSSDVEIHDGQVVRFLELSDHRVARLDPLEAMQVMRADAGWPFALATLLSWLIALLGTRRRRLASPTALRRLALLGSVVLFACMGGDPGGNPRDRSTLIDELPIGATFYLTDVRRSAVATIDATGSVETRRLGPYGSLSNAEGDRDRRGFLGAEHDESGLVHLGARAYRPDAGIFISPDPLAVLSPETSLERPASLYPYAYGASDPINHTDSSGLVIDTLFDIAFITVDVVALAYHIGNDADSETIQLDVAVLIVDVACAAVPFATGGGQLVRGGALMASKTATQATVHTVAASTHGAAASTHAAGASTHGGTASSHSAASTSAATSTAHGNSASSTRPTHGYRIDRVEVGSGRVTTHKHGISSGRIRADGQSVRGQSQARRLTREAEAARAQGQPRVEYRSEVTYRAPDRATALRAEQASVTRASRGGAQPPPGNKLPRPRPHP